MRDRICKSGAKGRSFWRRYRNDRRGNVAVMVALMIVPLVGMLALAGQVSSWYVIDRSLQNATDASAVAAAKNGVLTNDLGGVPGYQREASVVASQYGLVDGTNSVHVSSSHLTTCPGGASSCFQVTITKTVPALLTGIVGLSSSRTISANSIASGGGGTAPFCIVALGGAGISQPLLVHGGPSTDLNGCFSVSNGSADCKGHALGNSGGSYAISTPNDCAPSNNLSFTTPVTDPYAGLAASIPSNTCPSPTQASSYPQEPKKGFPAGSPNLISGTISGTVVLCGDRQLSGNLTLNAGAVLVIENGQFDTGSFSVTANGATIIFTGPNIAGFTPSHIPTGGGTLNLTAPTSGTWKDIAIYQDPGLTSGVDIANAGNGPTWNINGVLDLPKSQVTIAGAINKGVTDCMGLIVASLTIDGNGAIANDAGCGPIGLSGVVGGSSTVALIQ